MNNHVVNIIVMLLFKYTIESFYVPKGRGLKSGSLGSNFMSIIQAKYISSLLPYDYFSYIS